MAERHFAVARRTIPFLNSAFGSRDRVGFWRRVASIMSNLSMTERAVVWTT